MGSNKYFTVSTLTLLALLLQCCKEDDSLKAKQSEEDAEQAEQAEEYKENIELAKQGAGEAEQAKRTADASDAGKLVDERDGKRYKIAAIGDFEWMAENINYAIEGSQCYDYDGFNCDMYGSLYTWEAAKKACPKGWHLPSRSEWNELAQAAGGKSVAGEKLKSKKSWGGTDDFGFSALPAGVYSNGFFHIGEYGIWWTATKKCSSGAFYRTLRSEDDVFGESSLSFPYLYSVRCIKDYADQIKNDKCESDEDSSSDNLKNQKKGTSYSLPDDDSVLLNNVSLLKLSDTLLKRIESLDKSYKHFCNKAGEMEFEICVLKTESAYIKYIDKDEELHTLDFRIHNEKIPMLRGKLRIGMSWEEFLKATELKKQYPNIKYPASEYISVELVATIAHFYFSKGVLQEVAEDYAL